MKVAIRDSTIDIGIALFDQLVASRAHITTNESFFRRRQLHNGDAKAVAKLHRGQEGALPVRLPNASLTIKSLPPNHPTRRPNVGITLLRTENLGAQYARFQVPLHFSKLDLRDYLWHVYNVGINSVRSYVKQSRVVAGKPKYPLPTVRRWHRPKATKFMTVELQRPFVWPEEPEDYQEWNQKEVEGSSEEQEKANEEQMPSAGTKAPEERMESMREQAKALLEGKAKWKAPVRSRYGVSLPRT